MVAIMIVPVMEETVLVFKSVVVVPAVVRVGMEVKEEKVRMVLVWVVEWLCSLHSRPSPLDRLQLTFTLSSAA